MLLSPLTYLAFLPSERSMAPRAALSEIAVLIYEAQWDVTFRV